LGIVLGMTVLNLPNQVFREETAIDALISPAADSISNYQQLVCCDPGIFSTPMSFRFVWNIGSTGSKELIADGSIGLILGFLFLKLPFLSV